MERQAKICWPISGNLFQDDIIVNPNFDGLTVNRWAPDLSYEFTRPMFSLRVLQANNGSTVIMDEGECDTLCAYDSFTEIHSDGSRDLRCEEK